MFKWLKSWFLGHAEMQQDYDQEKMDAYEQHRAYVREKQRQHEADLQREEEARKQSPPPPDDGTCLGVSFNHEGHHTLGNNGFGIDLFDGDFGMF